MLPDDSSVILSGSETPPHPSFRITRVLRTSTPLHINEEEVLSAEIASGRSNRWSYQIEPIVIPNKTTRKKSPRTKTRSARYLICHIRPRKRNHNNHPQSVNGRLLSSSVYSSCELHRHTGRSVRSGFSHGGRRRFARQDDFDSIPSGRISSHSLRHIRGNPCRQPRSL